MVPDLYKDLKEKAVKSSYEENHRPERERKLWPARAFRQPADEGAKEPLPASQPIDGEDPLLRPRLAAKLKFSLEADNERLAGGPPAAAELH